MAYQADEQHSLPHSHWLLGSAEGSDSLNLNFKRAKTTKRQIFAAFV